MKNYYHAPQCVGVKRKKGFYKFIEIFFEKLLSQKVDYYLACGPSECLILNQKYNVPIEKIVLCPNFKNINRDLSTKKIYEFVYIGRMVKEKGIYKILDIFKILNILDKIVMIGDGKELVKIRKKYPEVNFTGRISSKEVLGYLAVSRFYVSNSIIEGLPFALIEAMQMGVVPIISNVEGHKDLVINNYNGFIYDNQLDLINYVFKTQLLNNKEYDRLSMSASVTAENLAKIAKEDIKINFKKYE